MLLRTYTAFGQAAADGGTSRLSASETDLPNSIIIQVGDESIILAKADWLELVRRCGEYSYSDFTWADEPAEPTTEV